MRLALLGFGLIGGSVARALRGRAHAESLHVDEIVAWSPSGAGPAAARRDGVIDDVAPSPDAAVAGADLIVLAGPAPDIVAQLDELAGRWRGVLRPDVVITDVASTKAAIVERAAALELPFVGGHPMAGREASGYEASTADLFVDRPWVVVPGDDVTAVQRVEALAVATGARPRQMTAIEHDDAVAAISHLPLVVAAALVESVAGRDEARGDWPLAAGLAATGWRDMTRLARGDTTMGAGIAVTNGPRIARRIRDLVAVLDSWAADLERAEDADRHAVARRLRSARKRLEESP